MTFDFENQSKKFQFDAVGSNSVEITYVLFQFPYGESMYLLFSPDKKGHNLKLPKRGHFIVYPPCSYSPILSLILSFALLPLGKSDNFNRKFEY